MHPILFRIGDYPIGTYALTALLGLVAGCALFSWLASRDGRDRMQFVELGLWAFIIALTASKLFGALVAFDMDEPLRSLKELPRSAGHYYIGVLAGVTFLALAFRRLSVPIGTGLDYLAPALALAHGIGRLGCFLAGCCFGKSCSLPWAVTFTDPEAKAPLNVALHPTQLYEFAAEIVIAGALLLLHLKRRGRPGTTFLWYVVLYGIVRFLVEFLRDDPRGRFFGMPTSQPIAVISAVVAGIILLVMAGSPSARAGSPSAPAGSPPARAGSAPARAKKPKRA